MRSFQLYKSFVILFVIGFNLDARAAYPASAQAVEKMMPPTWTFNLSGPFAVWDNVQNESSAIFMETKREEDISITLADLSHEAKNIFAARTQLLNEIGLTISS